MRGAATLTLACIGLAGCGGGTDDSEGDLGSAAVECRIRAAPRLVIGGLEPPAHVFGSIVGASVLPDGRTMVLDGQALEILVFDSSGTVQARYGGEGEGPGEFHFLGGWVLEGFEVSAHDPRLGRVTTYDLRTGDFRTALPDRVSNPRAHLGSSEGGWIFHSLGLGAIPEGGGFGRHTQRAIRVDSTGAILDTLGVFPGRFTGWVDRERGVSDGPTFGPDPSFATAPGRAYWASGDSALVFGFEGGETVEIRWDEAPRPVDPVEFEAYRTRWLNENPDNEWGRRILDVMPVADAYPVLFDLVADATGGVWVGGYPVPTEATRRWTHFVDGAPVCTVEGPAEWRWSAVGPDWIAMVGEDGAGAPRVEIRELTRSGAGRP